MNFLNNQLVAFKTVVITWNSLFQVIIIFTVAYVTNFVFKKIIKKAISTGHIKGEHAIVIRQIISYFIFIIAILVALDSIGIQLTTLLVGSAALLVGIGFGLQQLFLDVISGFILLFDSNIKIGDVIHTPDFTGRVKNVGLRTMQIVTTDDIVFVVPNSKITTISVTNFSHGSPVARFRIKVGVAYGSDVGKVKDILIDCAKRHSQVEKNPEPDVLFRDFAESSLDFELRFWTKELFRIETVFSDLRFIINQKFKEEGIVIPFPQRDIHIKGEKVG